MKLQKKCMILALIIAYKHVESYPTDDFLAKQSSFEIEPNNFAGRILTKWSETDHFGNPEEQGPYFEGDIIVSNERTFFTRQAKKWKHGIIPYKISGSFTEDQTTMIKTAIEEIESKTCIKLVPHSSEKDFIIFNNDVSGCWSKVGRGGGSQTINLQSQCFKTIGTIIHEILHAVGLFHEQNRSDRDDFIEIVTENIRKKSLVNFQKFIPNIYDAEESLYDYESILHYSPYAFSINGKQTIKTKGSQEIIKLMGQRKGLSEGDILKINMMYKCLQ
ncbi:unnamed protein product [Chironomus riparius]|uniref:Metalloendopeptidase n=1 Tax=Chironomus riparius TaxID=315576 RepID=A0A9N9WVH3_9DIPT|nr:unnamed protein product [Chironomus riparius]